MLATAVDSDLALWWWSALGVGLVVAVVLVVLLHLLLTRVRQIEAGAEKIWFAGKEVARNTATTWMLGVTANTVEAIAVEAVRHDHALKSKGV